jgi:hypothetical protein
LLAVLLVTSVMCAVGWLGVSMARQAGTQPRHRSRRAGLLASRRGALPGLTGVTLFLAAGWLYFIAGSRNRGITGTPRYAVELFTLLGVAFVVFSFVLDTSRRPRRRVRQAWRSTSEPFRMDAGDVAPVASRELTLRPGEYEAGRFFANHVQGGQGQGYGGRLFMTNERLVFIPMAGSQSNGASRAEFDLRNVVAAEVAPRGTGPGIGSLRRRLRVRMVSGDVEYFVVWRPRKLAVFIDGLLHGGAVRRPTG